MGIITERPRDCLACKLIGGLGLISCGAYVMIQSKYFNGFRKSAMLLISTSLVGLGTARLFDLPPFADSISSSNSKN